VADSTGIWTDQHPGLRRITDETGRPRHSAADHLWRQTGGIVLAQQLLRHESPSTTAAYLHPTRDDLAAALAALEEIPR
jgi:integrase